MRITIHAEDLLSDNVPRVLTLDRACTLGEAVKGLPLTRSTGLIILVNGRLAGWETALQDGDEVELVPALGGG